MRERVPLRWSPPCARAKKPQLSVDEAGTEFTGSPLRCRTGDDEHRSLAVQSRDGLGGCAVALAIASGCAPDELPVVARGRYVEIATDRDEPVCGGTADYLDRFLEAGFVLIGETAPDRVFVRYEWRQDSPIVDGEVAGGVTRVLGKHEHLTIETTDVVHEHELAHAVHDYAWGRSNRFLEEGFAVLLDAKRIHDPAPWPTQNPVALDDVIAGDFEFAEYQLAYYLVSQIVADHGWEGLKELWHAVPEGSSAAQVHAAYEELFGEPMDLLLERRLIEIPGLPSWEEPRTSCDFALCPMPSDDPPFVDGTWIAGGPTDCEDDPFAVGPSGGEHINYQGFYGNVWRAYTFVTEPGAPHGGASALPDVSTFIQPCELVCDGTRHAFDTPGPYDSDGLPVSTSGRYRIEVRAQLSDLPTDEPGVFTFEASP